MTISVSIFESVHSRSIENIGRVRILVLFFVATLHILTTIWLLKSTQPPTKKAPQIIEVVMLKQPEPVKVVPIEKKPPPAPVVTKEPIKPVVKPKFVTVKQPEPVKKITQPKPVLQPKIVTTVSENVETSIPKFESAPATETLPSPPITNAFAKPVGTSGRGQDDSKSTGVECIKCDPPVYPARLKSRHIEGWVKIEFTITPEGEVTDAAVIEAEPVDVFDEIVLSKVESWQLKPKIVNGIAVKQRATKTLQFKLTN